MQCCLSESTVHITVKTAGRELRILNGQRSRFYDKAGAGAVRYGLFFYGGFHG